MYQIVGAVQASRQPARLYLCQGLYKLGKGLHSTCIDAFEFSLLDKEILPRSIQSATHLFTLELRRLSFKQGLRCMVLSCIAPLHKCFHTIPHFTLEALNQLLKYHWSLKRMTHTRRKNKSRSTDSASGVVGSGLPITDLWVRVTGG